MSAPIVAIKVYLKVWGALLLLLALTVAAAYVPMGEFHLPVALAISVTKAFLIVFVFMEIKWGGRLLHLAAIAALLWLAIFFVLTFNDYLTRDLPSALVR